MRSWIDTKAKALARGILRAAVRVWPAESLEWGRAIETELETAGSSRDALLWTLGGAIVFIKAIGRSFWHSLNRPFGVPAESNEKNFLVSARRGPRTPRWVTLLMLACAGVVLLLPEARQGVGEVVNSWGGFPRSLAKSELAKLAKQAERERDAKTLAFVAIELHRESSPQRSAESVRLGEAAIALDPSLTWIYVNLVAGHQSAPIPVEWVKRLQQWDPENAVPHLLDAERMAREFRIQGQQEHPGALPIGSEREKLLVSQANWLDAMARAIAAPRFDSYTIRHSELNREVMRRKKIERPTLAGFALMSHPALVFFGVGRYTDVLLERGTQLERAGDLNAALDIYWRMAHFAERLRMQGQSRDIQTMVGTNIQIRVYEKLQTILEKQGRISEAELLSYNVAETKRSRLPRTRFTSSLPMANAMIWVSMLVNVSAVLIVLLAGAMVVSVGLLMIRPRRWLSPSSLTALSVAAEFLPVLLLLCCGAFALSYHPFAQTLQTYLTTKGEITDLRPFVDSFAPLASSGGITFGFMGQRIYTVYFWWVVIAIGSLAVALLLMRMFWPRAVNSAA